MASGRGLRVALVLVSVLGCAREVVPAELIGSWRSEDPRYADRSLAIGTQQIRFGVDAGVHDTYQVQGIERESDPGTGTVYRLFYDAPGEPERELRLQLPTPGQLRIDNHSEVWTRAGAPTTGG